MVIFLAALVVWDFLPAFSRYSVRIFPHVDVFLMYLWEEVSSHPSILPSWSPQVAGFSMEMRISKIFRMWILLSRYVSIHLVLSYYFPASLIYYVCLNSENKLFGLWFEEYNKSLYSTNKPGLKYSWPFVSTGSMDRFWLNPWMQNPQIEANCTKPFYIRDMNIYIFWYPQCPQTNPPVETLGWL